MSARTIALRPRHLPRLRAGEHVWLDDSDEQQVLLLPAGADHPGQVFSQAVVLQLGPTDLDLIEFPEGLHCASTDGATGWLVRVAS